MRFAVMVALCLAVLVPTETRAQAETLSLADVLTRAREQAPQVVSGRLALDEVRARVLGASLRFQQNPEIEAALGRRRADTDRFTDIELRISQPFEPRSRRAARIASVSAAVDLSSADLDETIRLVMRQAAIAYYQGLHAAERERLWMTAEKFAAGIEQAADRRFRAGDIAILDVNLARASRARARAERESAAAARANALGDLQQLLQIDETIELGGTLETPTDRDLPALVQVALARPELRGFDAAIREAEAELQLGRSFSQPDYGFSGGYERGWRRPRRVRPDHHLAAGVCEGTGSEGRRIGQSPTLTRRPGCRALSRADRGHVQIPCIRTDSALRPGAAERRIARTGRKRGTHHSEFRGRTNRATRSLAHSP